MTASEMEEVMKIKAQMEQQIEALTKQLSSIEERAMFAKTSKPLQLAKSAWYDNIFYKNVSSHYYVPLLVPVKIAAPKRNAGND